MEKKCYALICVCYSGENSISVFWNEEDAYKAMSEDLETEIANLIEGGYQYVKSKNDINAKLNVPENDIYYEWNIEETTIR